MRRATVAVQLSMLVGIGVAAFAVAPQAGARSSYMTAWRAKYAGTTLDARMAAATGSACNVCHHPTTRSTPGNCYRSDIAARLAIGRTIQEALADVDGIDSDGDGIPNGVEIMMARPDALNAFGYSPGLAGPDGHDPCGSSPTAPVTNQLETPPAVHCGADFNHSGRVDAQDLFDFLNAWFSSAAAADFNGVDEVTVQDIFDFMAAWFAGC